MNLLTIKEAIAWIGYHRQLLVSRRYLQVLCGSNRLKSEVIGKMRFIREEELARFDFKLPGRPTK